MQKQSERIKYKNKLFKFCSRHSAFWSKQLHMIKTIIYNDIFTSLRCKKVQSPAKQFKELNVWFVTSLHQFLPSSAMKYLKTAIILTNQNCVIFSCIILIYLQHSEIKFFLYTNYLSADQVFEFVIKFQVFFWSRHFTCYHSLYLQCLC